MNESLLQRYRQRYQPELPSILQNLTTLAAKARSSDHKVLPPELASLFALIRNLPFLEFSNDPAEPQAAIPLKVGVVLSGGQAAGGHNVIAGLFDALKKFHPESRLLGFLDGPKGIVDNKTIEITEELLAPYRNQGGFDMIGSGRTKIETVEQFTNALQSVQELGLDGLVIVGGDDSNTNAALLAEYFYKNECKTHVIGVPKTIDGDLRNEEIEIPFGFDTACKTYAEMIGNILRDALSAKKYYFFIKLMGRSASHIALECAHLTHPNMTLIGEEIKAQGKTLNEITVDICNLICRRAEQGKDYGVILIPEGTIEFIPEFAEMIKEINALLADKQMDRDAIVSHLSKKSATCFLAIPREIQNQLLLDRDPHGNVQVSKIETERLFLEMVKQELEQRKKLGMYTGKFSAQPLFFGYEGRSGLPSNFDSQYCYSLGYVAALLIRCGATGYMSCIHNLSRPVGEWTIKGVPLTSMMTMELRHGQLKPVIKKALVDLEGKAFKTFAKARARWALEDDYRYPGPIQFFGPPEVVDTRPITMV